MSILVKVSLSKTRTHCHRALTPFSEMSHEYESQRNMKWNNFMIKLCTPGQLQKYATFWSVTARPWIYSSSLCHSHLSRKCPWAGQWIPNSSLTVNRSAWECLKCKSCTQAVAAMVSVPRRPTRGSRVRALLTLSIDHFPPFFPPQGLRHLCNFDGECWN